MKKSLSLFTALAVIAFPAFAPAETIRSAASGPWSEAKTWEPARVPGAGDDVVIQPGMRVTYDAKSEVVIRSVRVGGTLSFSRERDTELNVGYVRVEMGNASMDDAGVEDVSLQGEHGHQLPGGPVATLEAGSAVEPIPAAVTARVRLHYLEGMDPEKTPAIICRPGGRMDFHGAPMNRTWVKLAAPVAPGDQTVVLAEPVTGWKVGDDVIVTGSRRSRPEKQTEERRITAMEGTRLTLDRPLEFEHFGGGEFRSEVANLSRNVIVVSADPKGVRGHTMYHWGSQGSISYARFAHLGKENVLGRYPIHFHRVEDSMRGSSVVGAAIVDSHNRWVTVHGARYLLVRDCVGYQSLGHGFYLEDGTEIYNVLDRNLGVQSFQGPRMKNQALPFDPNEGSAFWWANGRNTLTRNVGVENDEYGFRFDIQKRSNFDSHLPIVQPDGTEKVVDVRTIGIWRFQDNEAHGNFAGIVVAANGNDQPDTSIKDAAMLERIKRVDWTGPDARHPHIIRNFTAWQSHYAFRPHSPCMLIDGLRLDSANYGVYRPAFDRQVYRDVHLTNLGSEPFNRGMDDASAQAGSITVDGFIVDDLNRGNDRHPVIHMTDIALADGAECHFRRVQVLSQEGRRPLFNRGGSSRVDPYVVKSVPYFIHDHFGPGRDAKIVSAKAKDLMADGLPYREERPLTGDESLVAEVADVPWPELLTPVDDVPPATIISSVTKEGGQVVVRGVTHDNNDEFSVTVNGQPVKVLTLTAGVADWEIALPLPANREVTAQARDGAGNLEVTAHRISL